MTSRKRLNKQRLGVSSKRAFCLITTIACEWLCELKLHNSEAKNILQSLVLYADADGECFPSIGRLARQTDLHADTIRRRLVFLEQRGLINRTPQWIDADGIRNGEQHGKRTSDKIRLLFPEDVFEKNGVDPESVNAAAQSPENDVHEQRSASEPVGPRVAPGQPSHSSKGLMYEQERELELEESPLPPLRGDSQDDLSWKAFERAWAEPIAKLSLVQEIWTILAPADRSTAVKAAAGYRAWRKAEKRPPRAISARNFLRERGGWAQWLSYSPGSSNAEQLAVEFEGSPAWRARCTIAKIAGRPGPVALDLREGRGNHVAPLAAEYLELDRYADDDPADWEFLDQKDGRCLAWCDFLRIEAWPIKFGTKRHEFNGRHYDDWPIKRTGLRVPCPWPPSYGSDEVPL